jgi:uncharacterized protein YceK
MGRRAGTCLVAVLISAFGGCGTANNLYKAELPGQGRVYGGVVWTANGVHDCAADALHAKDLEDFTRSACGALVSSVDLPLSAVADTLTLPVTISIAIRRWACAPPRRLSGAGSCSKSNGV